MHAVSHTAQWMAAARAQESEREDALFTDPLARDRRGADRLRLRRAANAS